MSIREFVFVSVTFFSERRSILTSMKLLLTFVSTFALLATVSAAQVTPAAGDLAVSEIMFNPGPDACVTDNNGEYFEITNISCKVLDLNNNVFFQDATITAGVVNPTGVFFHCTSTVATLPPLYPGQRFLFCRTNNSALNGGLTSVDYAFTSSPANADNSTVGTTSMNLNNGSTGDGIVITVGGPAIVPTPNPNGYVAGTVIETVSYFATAAPFTGGGTGQAAERKDLFAPMNIAGTANSANLALSTTVNTSCVGNTFVGTPRLRNSVDTSVWTVNTSYDSVFFPNTGTLSALGPVSVGAGSVDFLAGNGPALQTLYFGYADNAGGTAETPLSLLIPGNLGSIVIDIFTAAYLDTYTFDGAGGGVVNVGVPNNPLIIGLLFETQWLGLDPNTFTLIGSNGVRVTVCP